MRISRQKVAGLEAGAARMRTPSLASVSLVWTSHDTRVDPEELDQGEYIAADVTLVHEYVARGDAGEEILPVREVVVSERVTTDPRDLGRVRSAAGVEVGRVTQIDGDLLNWELTEEGEAVIAEQRAAAELARAQRAGEDLARVEDAAHPVTPPAAPLGDRGGRLPG